MLSFFGKLFCLARPHDPVNFINEGLTVDRFPKKGYDSQCPGEISRRCGKLTMKLSLFYLK
jgi:hypothetical protein